MKAIVFSALLVAGLTSCASNPSIADQQAADYGSPIEQAPAELAATAYLRSRLKDPMSAVYEWQPVEKGYLRGAPIVGRKTMFGYILNGTVNSKNSFGGYTGAQPYQFIFHDGVIVYAAHQDCSLGLNACTMSPF